MSVDAAERIRIREAVERVYGRDRCLELTWQDLDMIAGKLPLTMWTSTVPVYHDEETPNAIGIAGITASVRVRCGSHPCLLYTTETRPTDPIEMQRKMEWLLGRRLQPLTTPDEDTASIDGGAS